MPDRAELVQQHQDRPRQSLVLARVGVPAHVPEELREEGRRQGRQCFLERVVEHDVQGRRLPLRRHEPREVQLVRAGHRTHPLVLQQAEPERHAREHRPSKPLVLVHAVQQPAPISFACPDGLAAKAARIFRESWPHRKAATSCRLGSGILAMRCSTLGRDKLAGHVVPEAVVLARPCVVDPGPAEDLGLHVGGDMRQRVYPMLTVGSTKLRTMASCRRATASRWRRSARPSRRRSPGRACRAPPAGRARRARRSCRRRAGR